MKVYYYHPNTFEYAGFDNAELNYYASQREGKNVYFLPAYATFIQPPEHKDNAIRVWQGEDWGYVADYRANFYKADKNLNIFDITQVGEIEEGFILVSKKQGEEIFNNPKDYIIDGDKVRKKNKKEKQAQAEAEFNAQYFKTSLGYVKRRVEMPNNITRDFLSDILPIISVGDTIPTFTKDLEKSNIIVTEKFINECKKQVLIDAYGGQE